MNEQSNAPMSAGPSGPSSWFSVWMAAVTKPNEQTFIAMANSGNAKATTAYIWVFIGSLVNIFFATLVQNTAMRQILQQYGGSGQFSGGIGSSIITAVCGAPIAAIISVIFFAIFTAIVQWVAKMFGGRGTFDQLAYSLAAVLTPFSFVSALLTLLSAIPFVGLCFGIVSLLASIYALILEVMAVKGVNQFGWGQAAGSVFLPGLVFVCCILTVVLGAFSLLGPSIREMFNQINNSLVP